MPIDVRQILLGNLEDESGNADRLVSLVEGCSGTNKGSAREAEAEADGFC